MKKSNILVVCHDAGGAEIISAYVKKHQSSRCRFLCIVGGPAERIFRRKKIVPYISGATGSVNELLKVFKNLPVASVMTGTSWGSPLELTYIKGAKERGVRSITFLDHWVNYRERFGYPRSDWKNHLPDEIWVGDTRGLELAKKYFSRTKTKVRFVANPFFKELRAAYRVAVAARGRRQLKNILLVSEPIGSARNSFGDKTNLPHTKQEIMSVALETILASGPNISPVVLRLHPAEAPGTYDAVIKNYKSRLDISVSADRSMFADLAAARFVIGISTMFLVVARLCRVPAVSFIPFAGIPCPLPDTYVKKIKSPATLKRLLASTRHAP